MTECDTEHFANQVTLRSFAERSMLDQQLALDIASRLRASLTDNATASVAFSGGSTPAPMLEQLSEQELDWSRVQATLVDDRWVDVSHADSNEVQLRRCLQRNQASSLAITGLKTDHVKPEQAIADIERLLSDFHWPFDCVHLGMGTDGHTASWFADAPEYAWAINRTHSNRVIAVNPAIAPHPRISLTANAVLGAKHLVVQITGKEKREVLARALRGDKSLPISLVVHSDTPTTIYWAP